MDEKQLRKERIMREQRIARQCEDMLTSALRSNISSLGFKEHISVKNQKKISDAFAESNFSRASKRGWGEQVGVQTLNIVMEKHGFIQHYGVDRIRKSDSTGKYKKRGSFHLHIEKRPFISEAIKKSKVIEYAAQELGGAKAEYIMKSLAYILNKFDK